jgi:ferrochelatase
MRFSEPSIACAVDALVESGATRVVGVCLSPQWSDGLMGGYERAARAALEAHPGVALAMPHAWHREPEFVDALAGLVRDALARFPSGESTGLDALVPVVLTAHSLPRRIFDAEPGYVAQLRETAELVAERAGLLPDRWRWAYQSAGHTAEEWLRPDLTELFPELAAAGHRAVLVAPVQFLSDHLEVLYDIDIAAAAQARAAGLAYRRIAMPNTDPRFIAALAALVRRSAAAL